MIVDNIEPTNLEGLCSCKHILHFGKCKVENCNCETIYYGDKGLQIETN